MHTPTKHPPTCRTYGAEMIFLYLTATDMSPTSTTSSFSLSARSVQRLRGYFHGKKLVIKPLLPLLPLLPFLPLQPFTFYIFLRYCPPTSYNACVTWPSEQVFTPSIKAANVFPLSTATFCNCFNVSSAVSAFAF